jgi:hypothetical protein
MMFGKRIRIRALSTALGLLASLALSVVALPGTAHANCSGANEVTGTLEILGVVWATEQPVTNTCNGNRYYQTYFHSNYVGWRASVHISNDGRWEHHYGFYDTDFIYLDFADSNSHSLINICINDAYDNWYCGWGTNVTWGTAWSGAPNHTMTGF